MTEIERVANSTTASGETLRERAELVYRLLGELYGIKEWKPRREPLHELISTILSHRTTQSNEAKAFSQMWERFGSWEAIRDAPAEEIAETIAPSNWPDQKAPRIKAVLSKIIEERGKPDINFLADLPVEEAMAWLEALPGVGPKTASLVLLFCFHKAVLPVDTHVHRVSGRVGLIPPRATAEQAHELLLELLPRDADVLWNFHLNVLRHGQLICVWEKPRCERCVLREHCDYARTHGRDGK
ncbi:MAG TPA: endonuclease III, partial [Roseiflexaceae bacterium]|nr:endonuclease III [Roseiflexaceae bacterium]